MNKEEKTYKTFNIKMSVPLWKYTKMAAMNMDMTMMDFILNAVENFKMDTKKHNSVDIT
jgi:hypothetical protein